jgi:hypothetical protein
MSGLPSPHGDKLKALVCNEKLPPQDQPRVNEAIERYEGWLQELRDIRGTYSEIVTQMVSLLNTYKTYIEVHLIFDSEQDFLYRQKGQLKLDNTIIEEFLPTLVTAALRKQLQDRELSFGPTTCFSGIRFESSIASPHLVAACSLDRKIMTLPSPRGCSSRPHINPTFKRSSPQRHTSPTWRPNARRISTRRCFKKQPRPHWT